MRVVEWGGMRVCRSCFGKLVEMGAVGSGDNFGARPQHNGTCDRCQRSDDTREPDYLIRFFNRGDYSIGPRRSIERG